MDVPANYLNTLIDGTRLPSEMSRRTRPIDMANWKALEYRNLGLIMFPHIVNVLRNYTTPGREREMEDLAELWLHVAFLL
jgi:hypothetical protein